MKEVAAVFMALFFGDISTPTPAPPPPPVIVIKDPFNIFFDKGSAEVTPRMREVFRNAAVAFRLNPADKFIWVRGHADEPDHRRQTFASAAAAREPWRTFL